MATTHLFYEHFGGVINDPSLSFVPFGTWIIFVDCLVYAIRQVDLGLFAAELKLPSHQQTCLSSQLGDVV